MNKKIIIGTMCAVCVTIGIGTIIVRNSKKKELEKKPYLEEKYISDEANKLNDNQEKRKALGKKNNVAGHDVWQDKYDQSEEAYFELSEKEVIVTRDMGIKFINDVRPYTNEGGYEDKLEDMKSLTTEALGNMLYDQLSGLQPAPKEGFRKLEVKEVKPVQYKRQKDGTLLWEYDTVEDIINFNDRVVSTQRVTVNLLFMKVNGEWKVAEYTFS